jgi:hypothetical protein
MSLPLPMRQLIACLALGALTACPNVDLLPDGAVPTGPIVAGPMGGQFVRDGVLVDISAGSLESEQRIFVTIDDNVPVVAGRTRVSYGIRLSPSSLRLRSPIRLNIPILDERIPPAVDVSSVDARRSFGAEIAAEVGSRLLRLPDNLKVVELNSSSLGLFWLTVPTSPTVDRVEITPAEATLPVGQTQQYEARVLAPTGEVLEVPVRWSVIPARVGQISDGGLFTALAPGEATLTATTPDMKSSTAKAFVQGDQVGIRTAIHDNPFPTGNDLYGGAFAAGGLGTVLAGANGTVLIRDPAGAWSRVASAPTLTLRAVGGTSLSNAVAVGAQGTNGVLVEFRGQNQAPGVRVLTSVEPRHLWFDGTYGMAVGTGNDVLLRADGGWVTEYSPSFETLLDVRGDGQGRFVTVGARGSIYTYNPQLKVWDSLYQGQLSVLLRAAAFVDASGAEVWAVGGTQLFHFTNGGWVTVNLPANPVLVEYTGLGLLDGRVIVLGRIMGSALPGVVVAYDVSATVDADGGSPGAAFTSYRLRFPQIPRGLVTGGLMSTQGMVVGDVGAVWEWESSNKRFVERSSGFYGDVSDVAVTTSDVFAAVNECQNPPSCSVRLGTVRHRADGGWPVLGAPPFTAPVKALVAREQEVIVSTPTALWRYDGIEWTTVNVPSATQVNDLKFCGNALWAVGGAGAIYRGTATTLTLTASPTDAPLFSLYCPNSTEVWVAGEEYLAFQANNVWVSIPPRTQMMAPQPLPWRAVWAPGGGEGYAYGDTREGVYWNGRVASAVQNLGGVAADVVTDLWGPRIDQLYATGVSTMIGPLSLRTGFLLKFDGLRWTLTDSGAHRTINAINGLGTDGGAVWLGTETGGLLRANLP